jgi:hypothetical protein
VQNKQRGSGSATDFRLQNVGKDKFLPLEFQVDHVAPPVGLQVRLHRPTLNDVSARGIRHDGRGRVREAPGRCDQAFFLALAAKGKEAWNAWRRDPANKGVRVTFAGIDFSEAPRDRINFSGFEFGDHADFSGCKWRGVDWEEMKKDQNPSRQAVLVLQARSSVTGSISPTFSLETRPSSTALPSVMIPALTVQPSVGEPVLSAQFSKVTFEFMGSPKEQSKRHEVQGQAPTPGPMAS